MKGKHISPSSQKYHRNTMKILSKIFYPLCGLFIMVSCESSAPVTLDTSCKKILNNEWVSFSIKTSYYENGVFQYDMFDSRVMIHNALDTSKRELVVANGDGIFAKLTSDSIVFIDTDYMVVGQYSSEDKFYEELAMDILQGPMEYFPMYYNSDAGSFINYAEKATGYEVVDEDTLYTIPATKLEKHCYSNGTCKLKDAPITLFFSIKKNGFVLAKKIDAKWPVRREYVSSITDIAFNDCTFVTDSKFCIDSHRYIGYDFVDGDNFLPYRYMTNNTDGTEDVINYPLVNLNTEDTITLANMKGKTLLCLFNFHPGEESYKTIENIAGKLDNIIWLMPTSNNVNKLKVMVENNHLGNNIYYTKGFNLVLSNLNKFYLFNNSHRIVSFNDGNNVEQWLETIIKEL